MGGRVFKEKFNGSESERILNYNNVQMNYFYSCDLWIGDNDQKPSITITENNSKTIRLEFDFSKDYYNEKE